MILVTGHEPPDGFEANPSATLARRLDGESVGGHRIGGLVLPAEEGGASEGVVAAIEEHEPAIVLTAGFVPGKAGILVERLAFDAGDYLGVGEDTPEPEGPVGYVTTMSTDSIVHHLRNRDIPTALSIATETPLSDRVLFGALDHVTSQSLPTAVGSMGLPCTPDQAVRLAGKDGGEDMPPSIATETQLEALFVALKVTIQERQ